MAISASFRPLISFKVEAYGSRESRERTRRVRETGRREILLSTVKTAAVALVADSKTQLLDGMFIFFIQLLLSCSMTCLLRPI